MFLIVQRTGKETRLLKNKKMFICMLISGRDKSPTCYIKDSILPRLVKQPLSKKPAENFGFSFLRNSILSAKVKGHQRRSSSLSSSSLNSVLDWNKSTVKKSVSFSSDTSFKERRSNSKRTAVHESKVYKQGVLQGQSRNRHSWG